MEEAIKVLFEMGTTPLIRGERDTFEGIVGSTTTQMVMSGVDKKRELEEKNNLIYPINYFYISFHCNLLNDLKSISLIFFLYFAAILSNSISSFVFGYGCILSFLSLSSSLSSGLIP